jgi:uncharacterized protein YbdZ (MbtH family)
MHNNDNALPNDITLDGDAFVVLVNADGQHSIWPARKEIPEGWSRGAHSAATPKATRWRFS